MHAKIFQLSRKPIEPDNYVTPGYFENDIFDDADYIGDSVTDPTERKMWIEAMVNTLHPLFSLEDETLVYQGCETLLTKWIGEIKEKASHLNTNNFFDEAARLIRMVQKTHVFSGSKFYIADWCDEAVNPFDLIEYCKKKLKPGERLYIGSIIDYHY